MENCEDNTSQNYAVWRIQGKWTSEWSKNSVADYGLAASIDKLELREQQPKHKTVTSVVEGCKDQKEYPNLPAKEEIN